MLNCYCQVQLFLDNMVLANQNAKLTGPDQGFLVSRLVLTLKPWERGWCLHKQNSPDLYKSFLRFSKLSSFSCIRISDTTQLPMLYTLNSLFI
jgi:hypothetical protein